MVGQVGEWDQIPPGRPLLVDAGAGLVSLDPPVGLGASLPPSPEAAALPAPVMRGEPRTATVGPRVEANINLLYEVDEAVDQQVGGVGLYRTEFLFLARRTLPTEEEQVGVYRKLLSRLTGRPASIRTFDWSPDKVAHGPILSGASGSPLDWRLVLDSPPLRKLFKDQVRAILRAAAVGPARILVPWVTRAELLDFVLQTVDQARTELRREGLEHGRRVPVGIMIEVTAAAFLVEAWAERVDFFALGTNDLVASALGLDRDHPVGAGRNDMLHPGVLRMLRDVVAAAHRAGRLISVCGEMAADPGGVLALAALKVDSLSVPVNQLVPVREVLAGQTPETLAELERRLPLCRTADQAREFLSRALRG
jgi:phosphoenolpyruvate-protein kinase (PTS system EI component)